jgi:fumarylacetoacetate (FAA) hydrolase
MRLATLDDGNPDGILAVVSRDHCRCARVPQVARTLLAALESWEDSAPRLAEASRRLDDYPAAGEDFDPARALAPLPRAWGFLDGSAYLSHVERVRRARGAELPPALLTDPLMYQGCSAPFLAPRAAVPLADSAWGLDLEGEIGVVTGAVPAGAGRDVAAAAIRLLVLVNDFSLRGLIPDELAKGFGFVHGKPPSSLGPIAVTPDEAGAAWDGGKLAVPLRCTVNGHVLGRPEAGLDMQFDFPALVAHAARTRPLPAGTVVAGGTVSNRDPANGFACLLEQRLWEARDGDTAVTPYLQPGDTVRLEVELPDGGSLFGVIEHRVVAGG